MFSNNERRKLKIDCKKTVLNYRRKISSKMTESIISINFTKTPLYIFSFNFNLQILINSSNPIFSFLLISQKNFFSSIWSFQNSIFRCFFANEPLNEPQLFSPAKKSPRSILS